LLSNSSRLVTRFNLSISSSFSASPLSPSRIRTIRALIASSPSASRSVPTGAVPLAIFALISSIAALVR
jgi:hypothetical protein